MLCEAPVAAPRVKKKLVRRAAGDASQLSRLTIQLLFLGLNVWIGAEFYLFVRFYETGGRGVWVARPPGVEGWLPIASLMNLKYFLLTGEAPRVHPAGLTLLVAFLVMAFVFRKAFCSWLCPVGTLSEWLWKLGRSLWRRNFRLPRWPDAALRSLKYVLLGLFLYAIGGMSAAAIRAFLEGPYGLISDVKMLDFFRYLSTTAAVVLALLVLVSIFVQNAWCRYLCPYGALLGIFGRLSPARIRREPGACIDCAKCAQACPSQLAVDKLITIGSAECTACLECVAVCPAEGALFLSLPRKRKLPAWALAAGLAAIFVGLTGYARWTGHWHTDIPSQVYFDLIPRAREFGHP